MFVPPSPSSPPRQAEKRAKELTLRDPTSMKSSSRANTSETQKQKTAEASATDVLVLGTPGDDATLRGDAQGSSMSAGDAQSANTPAVKGAAKPMKTPLTNNAKCTASGDGGKHPDREDRPTAAAPRAETESIEK